VLLLAIGFIVGAYFGSKVAINLKNDTVKKVFAIIMLLLAIKMLFIDKPKPTVSSPIEEEQTKATPTL
jgi:uncharacterized protein